jgi:hypothetical protein
MHACFVLQFSIYMSDTAVPEHFSSGSISQR